MTYCNIIQSKYICWETPEPLLDIHFSGVDYNQGGQFIMIMAGGDNLARLRNGKTGEPLPSDILKGHKDKVLACRLTKDAKYALTGSKDQTAKLWRIKEEEADSQSEEQTFEHQGIVSAVSFSPDGKRFVTASEFNSGIDIKYLLKIYDLNQPSTRPTTFTTSHTGRISSVIWAENERIIVTAGFDGTVRIWDTLTMKEEYSIQCTEPITDMAYSRRDLVTWGSGNTAYIWNIEDVADCRQFYCDTKLSSVTLHSHKDEIYCASRNDSQIRVYDSYGNEKGSQVTDECHTGAVNAIRCHRGSDMLTTITESGYCRLWDMV